MWADELIFRVDDDLDRHVDEVIGSGGHDRAEVVGAVHLQAVGRVGLVGLRVVHLVGGNAVADLQYPGDVVGDALADGQRRQHGHGERSHVGQSPHLTECLHEPARTVGPLEAAEDEPVHVIGARAGHRRERGDVVARAGSGQVLPHARRTPVVGQHVHRLTGRDGVDHRGEIIGVTGHPVCRDAGFGHR